MWIIIENYLVFICQSQKQEYETVIASDQQQSTSETCEAANYLQPFSIFLYFDRTPTNIEKLCPSNEKWLGFVEDFLGSSDISFGFVFC